MNVPLGFFWYFGNIDKTQDEAECARTIASSLPYSEAVIVDDKWVLRWQITSECTKDRVRGIVVSFYFSFYVLNFRDVLTCLYLAIL